MSSEFEKEKLRREEEARRREEEARRRDEEAERIRQQVREKYEEGARRAEKASQEGADIAKRAAEEGARLGEEQTRRAYEDAQRKFSSEPEPKLPEPKLPQASLPSVPEPKLPEPKLPEPKLPEPKLPQANLPSVPEPKSTSEPEPKLPPEPQIKPTYLHTISSAKDTSALGGSAAQQDLSLPLTTVASTPPRVYYVIVGCGTAAVVNHTTLRQTKWGMKERIADFPVMHIGFDDPWAHYISHGMGQPPYLLTMPGYHQRPSQGSDVFDRNPGCNSARFAACTKNEWDLLRGKYHKDDEPSDKFAWKEAFLVWIESADVHPAKGDIKAKLKDEGLDLDAEKVKAENKLVVKLDENYVQTIPHARYRLLIVVPQNETNVLLEYVYAAKIDICVGPGRPRIPDGADWKEGRTKLWTPPRMWGDPTKKRKFVNGPEAFYTETDWNSTDRIYINGGGGIGLNMAERAEIVGCFADWAPTGTLYATFNLPRNDIVLKHPNRNINTASEGLLMEFCSAVPGVSNAPVLVQWIIEQRVRLSFTKSDLKTRIREKKATIREAGERNNFSRFEELSSDALFDLWTVSNDPLFHGAPMKPGESGVRVLPFMAPTNNKVVLTPAFE